jgi:glycerol-3-phosphate O-acyltransferase 3/4
MCWKHIQWNLNWYSESHYDDKLVPLPGPVVSLSWTAEVTLFLSQTVWVVVAMLVVGLVPAGRTKQWLYRRAYNITFRILARSLSAIITVHNKPNMEGGVCVANHTSPIDVVMLSTENCFALVSLRHINSAVVWICWHFWCLVVFVLMYLVFEM